MIHGPRDYIPRIEIGNIQRRCVMSACNNHHVYGSVRVLCVWAVLVHRSSCSSINSTKQIFSCIGSFNFLVKLSSLVVMFFLYWLGLGQSRASMGLVSAVWGWSQRSEAGLVLVSLVWGWSWVGLVLVSVVWGWSWVGLVLVWGWSWMVSDVLDKPWSLRQNL